MPAPATPFRTWLLTTIVVGGITLVAFTLVNRFAPEPTAGLALTAVEVQAGNDPSTTWLRVEITHPKPAFLVIDEPLIRAAALHAEPDQPAVDRWSRAVLQGKNGITARRPILSLPPDTGQQSWYLAVDAPYATRIPVTAWSSIGALTRMLSWHNGFVGFYSGAMALIFGLNLFVLWALRERSYGDYCLFLGLHYISLVAFEEFLIFTAVGDQLWEATALRITIPLSLFFLIAFSRRFLASDVHLPLGDRVLRVLQWLFLALTAQVSLVGAPAIWTQVISFQGALILATTVALLLCGASRARRGQIEFVIFTLAFVPHSLAAILFVLAQLNVLARSAGQYYELLTGSLLEMILLTTVIAISVRRVVQERERAQREAIEQLERRKEVERRYREELKNDVADRTRQLAEANTEKDRLLSILAHDLRSPVNSLVRYCELVQRDTSAPSAEDWRQIIDNIRDSGRSLYGLLENLLAWAQYNWQGLHPEAVPLDLTDLLQRHRRMLDSELRRRQIALAVPENRGPQVLADRDMVQTVIRNILTNALSSTPSGGTIEIALARQDGSVRLEVRNPGIPISEEALAILSKESSRPRDRSRYSLGLILCRELAAATGGGFSIEPKPGYGTIATLTLPAYEPTALEDRRH